MQHRPTVVQLETAFQCCPGRVEYSLTTLYAVFPRNGTPTAECTLLQYYAALCDTIPRNRLRHSQQHARRRLPGHLGHWLALRPRLRAAAGDCDSVRAVLLGAVLQPNAHGDCRVRCLCARPVHRNALFCCRYHATARDVHSVVANDWCFDTDMRGDERCAANILIFLDQFIVGDPAPRRQDWACYATRLRFRVCARLVLSWYSFAPPYIAIVASRSVDMHAFVPLHARQCFSRCPAAM